MAVAAAEVVVGLGLIVALARARRRRSTSTSCGACADERRRLRLARRCSRRSSASRSTSAIGSSVSRRTVGWVASLSILARLRRSRCSRSSTCSGATTRSASIVSTGWHWLSAGSFQVDVEILVDPLSVVMLLVVTGVGFLIHAYSVGYMHGDREEKRFFAYLNLFVFSMLLLVLAGQLRHPARRLGPRRPLLLPADRLLVAAPDGGRGGQEGVHHERDRRRRDRARHLRDLEPRALGRLPDRSSAQAPGQHRDRQPHRQLDRAAAARRRRRQVGAAAAAHLAARRDGGPDPGLRADPRRHDGDGRRLPRSRACGRSTGSRPTSPTSSR